MSPVVIGVATAIPAFIGYTRQAEKGGKDVTLTPILVDSLADFEATFGETRATKQSYLPASLRLFYQNGGGSCYVVSVGACGGEVKTADLVAGLDAIEGHVGPTMLVVPDALLLRAASDFSGVARKMLSQCGRLGDRVAILDVFGADTFASDRAQDLDALVDQFRDAVGSDYLSYGMSYFPCLYISRTQSTEHNPASFDVMPASGAVAGVYSWVDANRGVWNAPANVGVTGVVGPTFKVTDTLQEQLNVPVDGKAINAIRDFPGRGTLIWGARTLDGNSADYRYIQVRRTLLYVEQSIKAALGAFAFNANDGQTWAAVTAMASSFLTTLWVQGGLMGDTASEAFTVQCGIGSTMTGDDVLAGQMKVSVTLQMIRPAEFIELTFLLKMQE